MSKFKRKQLFVDREVQGALMIRVIGYWLYCLLSLSLMMASWMIVSDPPASSGELLGRMWAHHIPVLMASLVVLPMVVTDCIRVSNRFAGPVMRLRRAMKELADGRSVHPIHFRDGDFWCDFADDFNRLVAELDRKQPRNENKKHAAASGGQAALA